MLPRRTRGLGEELGVEGWRRRRAMPDADVSVFCVDSLCFFEVGSSRRPS